MVEDALVYYSSGWSVIPIKGPDTDVPKAPLLSKWERFQTRQPTRSMLHGWFGLVNERKTGIAIVCGSVSGIGVVDIDSEETFREICRKYEIDPCGANVVKTGRVGGGYHVYYDTGDLVLPNKNILSEGTEFQGEGSIVVAPPTVHPSGNRYEWVCGQAPNKLPSIPTWLLNELRGDKSPYASEVIPDGERDNTLTTRVGHWFKSGMAYSEVLSMAKAVNNAYCKPPMSEAQVIKIVNSIYKKEKSLGKLPKEDVKFDIVPFGVFMSEYGSKEVEWLVEGWMPSATCGIVSAVPGSFKTFALCDLAIAVATGSKFLGKFDVLDSGPVLLVQQEDSFASLAKRFAQILNVGVVPEGESGLIELSAVPMDIPIYMHTNREVKFDNPSSVAAFSEQVTNLRPKLVILDPLYSMAEADDYMTKAAQQMMFMKTLRDGLGTSFFIAHHMAKNKGDKGGRIRDMAWGSQFINAWLETGWEFMQDESGDGIVAHRHFKDEQPPRPTFMKFVLGDGTMEVVFDDDPSLMLEDRVRSLLLTEEIRSIQDVCERLSVNSKSKIQRILDKLEATKKDGVYKV